MICFFRSNGRAITGVVIPPLILFFLILICFSLPAASLPSRLPETVYNRSNPFPEKIFLNIDNGLITLIARNSSLGPILKEIGHKSGIIITISPALRSKKITVRWKDISLEEGIKKIAEDSGLLFRKDKEGNFYLSEAIFVPESPETSIKMQNNGKRPVPLKSIIQAKQADVSSAGSASSGAVISQNINSGNNILLNEMVIRFKQDISEQDIYQFLSDANIKVKKYIAALKYHILSLPEGMTHYDAMVLFKRKKMLYQAEPDYLIPVR